VNLPRPEEAFVVFDNQDSGCLSYGVESDGARWFVKTGIGESAVDSLSRAATLHAAVSHPHIVEPVEIIREGGKVRTLVYPWIDGTVLNHATIDGSDRSGLERFQQLPVAEVEAALSAILDAHLAIVAAGLVAVDLYDGCFLYDFDRSKMWLVDLDEYRPGPFTLDEERLPGSERYMAPEEWVRGSTIDQRTTVYALGRTLHHLLDSEQGWRGREGHREIIKRATAPNPVERHQEVDSLVAAWRAS
jgi:serine/threonine-protein kinase